MYRLPTLPTSTRSSSPTANMAARSPCPCRGKYIASASAIRCIHKTQNYCNYRIDYRKRSMRKRVVASGLFGLGVPELLVIGGVVAVVFGPQQIPELGKSLGKTAKSFQEAANEFKTELKKEMEEDVKSSNDISTGSDGGAAGGDGSENV